uniref:Uncharacterized protein n=1 Tax=Oryza meridionalis TaxID=40149 RepID=A0A0E0BYY3_9ORYZ
MASGAERQHRNSSRRRGGRGHHANLAAVATRPEAPSASSPNARLRRLITRDDLAEVARLVDR